MSLAFTNVCQAGNISGFSKSNVNVFCLMLFECNKMQTISSLYCRYSEIYYFLFCYIIKSVHFMLTGLLEYYSVSDD